jgi:hypothetical protein
MALEARTPSNTSGCHHLPFPSCSWLIMRRLRDLSLYDPASTLDLEQLAYSLFLHESHGANMMVSVGE